MQSRSRPGGRIVRLLGSPGSRALRMVGPVIALAQRRSLRRLHALLDHPGQTVTVLWPGFERQPQAAVEALDRMLAEGARHGAKIHVQGFRTPHETRFPGVAYEALGVSGGEIEFVLPAVAQSVRRGRKLVQAVAAQLRLSESERYDFAVAIGEALTNAVQHGSPRADADIIAVRLSIFECGFVAQVMDSGGWSERARGREHWASGRGLPIMRELVDDVQMESTESGTVVSLLKRHDPSVVTC